MESGTSIPGCPNPLPLFRSEAIAAHQALQGEVLTIRPFPWTWFYGLIVLIITSALAWGLFSHYERRASASGAIASLNARSTPAFLEATLYIPQQWKHTLRPGTSLLVRCAHCPGRALTGIVTGISADAASPAVATAGPFSKVTVTVSIPNSSSVRSQQFRPGTKLEAEFPLERRPLIRALFGAGAW